MAKPGYNVQLVAGSDIILASNSSEFVGTSGISGLIDQNGKITAFAFAGASSTNPMDVNSRGDIVGTYQVNQSAEFGFIYRSGVFTTLPATAIHPEAINNSGLIVGDAYDPNVTFGTYGFAYDSKTGSLTNIEVGKSLPMYQDTVVSDVNDDGEIVGATRLATMFGTQDLGFIYQNGQTTPFNVPNSWETTPVAINRNGDIAGTYQTAPDGPWQGFLFHDGTFTTIDIPAVSDLNDNDIVVGATVSQNQQNRALVYANGKTADITPTGVLGAAALTVNNQGSVGGIVYTGSGTEGFIAT